MPLKYARKYPVLKTMVSYLFINSAADCSEQVLIKKHTWENYDVGKTIRMGATGCFVIGPLIYRWIKLIEKMIPGKTVFKVAQKVVCDSCFFAPIGITSIYLTTNILEMKPDITKEWKEKFFRTWKSGLMFWPLAQTINFAFIPPIYKTSIYMPICSFMWMNYICYMKDQKISGDETEETEDTITTSLHTGKLQMLTEQIPNPSSIQTVQNTKSD